MTPERKKLLDRVLALLALAEGNVGSKYDGEARSARARAEE